MSRLRSPLTRVLALLLLTQWAAAFAHCLAPLAAAAHGVEICTADGITTVLLGADDRPAPKPAIHHPSCPECGSPAALEAPPPPAVSARVAWNPAARARPVEGLPVAPARAPPQQPRAPPIA
ncbi:MAG TPA: DUF2946 family protein [Acetobacteraceae bacterium]|nr:DUF2946 family protein [Acetobacteraceae bacterium]